MPPDAAEIFREQARGITRVNLTAVTVTAQLARILDGAGIDWITFKGLALAAQVYGLLGVKASNDIDILVPQDATGEVCALLIAAGYTRFNPGREVRDDQLAAWIRISKEIGWKHPGTGLIVELHGRVMANPSLFPEANIAAPRKRIQVAQGLEVPTMGDSLLFPYLVAHGAHSGWFRLKWLADVAALLARDPEGIERQYREAEALGVGRCAAQALLLAQDLLALPLAPDFAAELRARRVHRRLVGIAMRSMAGAFEAREHGAAVTRSLLPVVFGNLLLRRGLGYKWHELASLAANPVDRSTGRLSAALGFLYPVLGGIRWSARVFGRAGKRQGAA